MAFNAASVYQKTNVYTASPAELTLMLYDGAVKFCNMALLALEKQDMEKCNYNIQKAKAIIVEFRSTLDFKYEVSHDFDRVYDYIYWVLTQANIKKDPELLNEALKRIREMRDTWKEVMKKTKTVSA
ncbi:MAG: flagellar secretion chaperone FliS [Clostridiales bacterium]|nr:flagellar secretion chaperone FliS [Clostridiales bacterium]